MLLDRWLPEFDVSRRYGVTIGAPRERVYDELLRYDFGDSIVTTVLMGLRGYGSRRKRTGASQGSSLKERLSTASRTRRPSASRFRSAAVISPIHWYCSTASPPHEIASRLTDAHGIQARWRKLFITFRLAQHRC